MIGWYFLFPAVNAQIFNPAAERAIMQIHEANTKIETQPLTAETKARKCSK